MPFFQFPESHQRDPQGGNEPALAGASCWKGFVGHVGAFMGGPMGSDHILTRTRPVPALLAQQNRIRVTTRGFKESSRKPESSENARIPFLKFLQPDAGPRNGLGPVDKDYRQRIPENLRANEPLRVRQQSKDREQKHHQLASRQTRSCRPSHQTQVQKKRSTDKNHLSVDVRASNRTNPEWVERAMPYSTGSIVNPDSSLISPPNSPELTPKADLPEPQLGSEDDERIQLNSSPPPPPPAKKSTSLRARVPVRSESTHPPLLSDKRVCYSCGRKDSPCWRPSWAPKLGQLCNSCGLRYRKTRIHCPSLECRYVPSKLDLAELRARDAAHLHCPECSCELVAE